MKLDRRLCDVRDIVADAWSTIELQGSGSELIVRENGSVADTKCVADPLKLEQVFRNLFENAVSACDGRATIEVSYDAPDAASLRIAVSDNGPGLTEEQRLRICEPFFTTKTQGTGLGMAIVKRIVDAHDGEMDVESSCPQGAVIVVTLPRGRLSAGPLRQDDMQKSRTT